MRFLMIAFIFTVIAASASAVHGPVEAFPSCGAANAAISVREKVA